MTYNDFLNKIIRFNGDKDLLMMREKYNNPSFFEIISKERSETTFSSFLKWLFSCNMPIDASSPVMMLLDILVRRSNEQQNDVTLFKKVLEHNRFKEPEEMRCSVQSFMDRTMHKYFGAFLSTEFITKYL